MVKFFISRPKTAIVLSVIMSVLGALAAYTMPVGQYPDVAPPMINVFTQYNGANSSVVNDTVASVIEKEVNGVEGMIYMKSTSSNDGSYNLNVTFETGFDADRAATLVQNRVNAAQPLLPDEVKRSGIYVEKLSPSMLMIASLNSQTGAHDTLELSYYLTGIVRETLSRIKGVSKVTPLGEKEYAMRVWLEPERLQALDLTVNDISAAIADQNAVRGAGSVGAEPVTGNNDWQYTVQVRGRLANEQAFGNIRVKAYPDGTLVRLKDVARIELGAQKYLVDTYLNNQESVAMMIYQDPTANAMQVAEDVRAAMAKLEQSLPNGMVFSLPYDATEFIDVSIYNVQETLVIALILVTLVTYLFLQTWQATLIPAIAIPVSLIATFAVMKAFGSTINTISLFGLVLAIGVVVDAAIVVIENVERLLHETTKPVKECVEIAMKEVIGPCIAAAAVLLAVFGPTLVMPGMVGIIYAEFGIAISVSVVISTLVAMTLTPALCVMLMNRDLKPNRFFQAFNRGFERFTELFGKGVAVLCRRVGIAVLLFAVFLGASAYLGASLPGGFLPDEDQGTFFAVVDLPEGAALNRTRDMTKLLVESLADDPDIEMAFSAAGYNLLNESSNSNSALLVFSLKHWDQRSDKQQHQDQVIARVQAAIDALPEGVGFAFGLPAIPALGMVNGFEFVLKDEMGKGPEKTAEVLEQLLEKANQREEIASAFSTFSISMPNLYLDINEERAAAMGVAFGDIVNTLNVQYGGSYINDFTKGGRNYRVMLQAEADSRQQIDDLSNLYVRSSQGEMVRLSNLVSVRTVLNPSSLVRYNVSGSTTINGITMPSYSSGQAIAAMEQLANEVLPTGFSYEWTGLTLQEQQAGNASLIAFAFAMLFTYLFLVAQYESWLTPLAILLAVPTAVFGVLSAVLLSGTTINLYSQIAIMLLIGMASRNAILIVEFAKQLREQKGYSIVEAGVAAAKLRFRAVLMTAFSFILGVVPLMLASSAGAAAMQAIGMASFGGMLAATVLGCLFVPAFFVLFQTLRERFSSKKQPEPELLIATFPASND
ncbi:efflux RND transporter permease subunit [Agarivorans sp. B2Z047]|uniref:efflux RND transporter permease subunit n=1 Tax=Agarivorans sp. B2Z047 TaxID=2652721 RepID=UPI00128E63CD|nr:efflux RND transporter permease subunit [Agarivorans sp. B2Z047]MPW29627.1 efflux RND transporter permease subunit [Agarivorans sp. B2Z047]UQN40581.1 efflux RND transporter permease subunit [Agarivorans sp. B2Z047]